MNRSCFCLLQIGLPKATLLFLLLATLDSTAMHAKPTYDPLAVVYDIEEPVELNVNDEKRSREIPLRVYLPNANKPMPVVLFSHGLGGSRKGSSFIGKHLAARGYVAVFLQHPGSDESVWKNRTGGRLRAMREAASAENLVLRCEDVHVVLDALVRWQEEPKHMLSGRIQPDRIGMSGHSFGARTTQTVAGGKLPLVGRKYFDERINAAIVYSPSSPLRDTPNPFAKVAIPWLLMTGTKDVVPIGRQTAETRQKVYPALPKTIDKFELVLHEGEHFVFTDRVKRSANSNHHPVILALTTAFWDAYLKEDKQAQSWLTGEGARALMEPKDRWQWHLEKR